MATHKASGLMEKLCKYCKERPATTDTLAWYTVLTLLLLGSGDMSSRCCEDCAGGRNLLALLFLAAAAVFLFVVAVILW